MIGFLLSGTVIRSQLGEMFLFLIFLICVTISECRSRFFGIKQSTNSFFMVLQTRGEGLEGKTYYEVDRLSARVLNFESRNGSDR